MKIPKELGMGRKGMVCFLALLFAASGWVFSAENGEIKEANRFLIFGMAVKPAVTELKNSWVIGEGRDYSIFGNLMAGYEVGLYYRFHQDRTEYGFKTFFNLKLAALNTSNVKLFLGGGAGLLETLRIMEQESGFRFNFGAQGVIGVDIGAPGKDKLCFEVHVVKAGGEFGEIQVHLLAGVRY